MRAQGFFAGALGARKSPSQGFVWICEDLEGFAKIRKDLCGSVKTRKDLQGFSGDYLQTHLLNNPEGFCTISFRSYIDVFRH